MWTGLVFLFSFRHCVSWKCSIQKTTEIHFICVYGMVFFGYSCILEMRRCIKSSPMIMKILCYKKVTSYLNSIRFECNQKMIHRRCTNGTRWNNENQMQWPFLAWATPFRFDSIQFNSIYFILVLNFFLYFILFHSLMILRIILYALFHISLACAI